MESPANSQVSPKFPSSGGGTSYPVLVAPTVTEGVIQREPDGSVSATVNVSASTGGSGAYTYSAVTLNKPGGSGASLSGTAPGALSLSSLADGEDYVAYGTVTDDTTGQVVQWSHMVTVAAPADFDDPTATGVTRSLASGTTSTTYTLAAPSEAGEGTLVWTRALVHDAGSGASVSGSDTGLQTVSGLEDEDMVTITHTAEDDRGRQRVYTVSFSVRKAAAANGWQVVAGSTKDWTGLDSLTLTANASNTVQKSAVDFEDVYFFRTGANNVSYTAGAAGLTQVAATSGAGRASALWDESSSIGAGTLTAADWAGTKAFQFLVDSIAFGGNGHRLAIGLGDSSTDLIGSGDVACAYWEDDGLGFVDIGTYSDGLTATTPHTGETKPTSAMVTILVFDGVNTRIEITNGVSVFASPSDASVDYGGMTAGTSVSPGNIPVQLPNVSMGMAAFQKTGCTLTNSRVLELIP